MKITEIPAKPKEKKKVRVAAYARVSSDKDAAFHSLEAQKDYYEQYAAQHQDWELVGIYSDNGISGTTNNRPEFQRMIQDCRDGKIDLVITKSVTRFARNTVILLETIRELKELGVDCYFEKENMHSISPDGELLLTLLAMYAEEEARSTSENQKWRIRKRFESGEPWVGKMLGYRLQKGQLVIIPEEAKIVRRIFNEYLSGKGIKTIANMLNEEGIPTLYSYRWNRQSIYAILQNEKYSGDMLLQKTYRKDFRTKKTIRNKGEKRMYHVENSHEAIIPRELFDMVKREMERRKHEKTADLVHAQRKNRLFTGKLMCGICGRHYYYKIANSSHYPKPVLVCPNYFEWGKAVCPSQKVPEDILIEKTKEVLGIDEITMEAIDENITVIMVPEHNHLVFYLRNDDIVDVHWKHHSRSKSWTPEMREAARERTLKRHRKEDK